MDRFFFRIFYSLFFISIFSCEENPIIVENKNLPLDLDTLSEDSDHSYNLYIDSLIVDSAEISLKSFSDTLISNQKFNLR